MKLEKDEEKVVKNGELSPTLRRGGWIATEGREIMMTLALEWASSERRRR